LEATSGPKNECVKMTQPKDFFVVVIPLQKGSCKYEALSSRQVLISRCVTGAKNVHFSSLM
jgi:hypothetical protein